MDLIVVAVLAYLLGSLSFAVIVSRLMRLGDPRGYGSGNPGATNVLRSGSKVAAALTLLLDAAKGWLAVMLVVWYGPQWGLGETAQAVAGVAAFAGHVWPLWFGFKGGKGVATAAGVLLAFEPLLGLSALAVWLLMLALFRYSSLAALTAAVLAPVLYLLGRPVFWQADGAKVLAMIIMAVILLWRHHANIRRLLAHEEPKVGSK